MLRNREIRRFAALFLTAAAVSAAAAFAVGSAAGFLAAGSAAAFGALFWRFTKARYQSLARLADEIDCVLHHEDHLYISEMDEGELSILQSEITKMTRRIREQNGALQKEKERLADALADIAHQLRTPLTSANLILSLLESQAGERERKAMVREAEELFVQMDWLLASLLKLSRLDAGIVVFQCEPVEVNALVNAALRPFLIPMDLHDIALQRDVPNGIVLRGDFGWLSEAMQNLLKNCVESAGDHGKITISCEDNPLYTEITVRDSGPGFEKTELPHLFDRFYRGKNAGAAGYGIGLALCKMIITRQGGTVAAENHPQGGAVFAVRFPK